jgi:hypothetical protein
MNTVTYSDERVQDYLNSLFVPVRLHCDFDNPSEEMRRFAVNWTPTFLVLDEEGREHHRTVGFLDPAEFIAQMNLGRAKLDFDRQRLTPAIDKFAEVAESCPSCSAAPEAHYYLGVSRYKQTHDAHALREVWERLSREFPESEWAKKAEPYSQIE